MCHRNVSSLSTKIVIDIMQDAFILLFFLSPVFAQTQLTMESTWYDSTSDTWTPNNRFGSTNIHGIFSDADDWPVTLNKSFLLPLVENTPLALNQVRIFFTFYMACTVDQLQSEGGGFNVALNDEMKISEFYEVDEAEFAQIDNNPWQEYCTYHTSSSSSSYWGAQLWYGDFTLYINYTKQEIIENGRRDLAIEFSTNLSSDNDDEQWAIANVSISVYGVTDTKSPTQIPISIATDLPTSHPTKMPSNIPIATTGPTSVPTMRPSNVPSQQATNPSVMPTIIATDLPSKIASLMATQSIRTTIETSENMNSKEVINIIDTTKEELASTNKSDNGQNEIIMIGMFVCLRAFSHKFATNGMCVFF